MERDIEQRMKIAAVVSLLLYGGCELWPPAIQKANLFDWKAASIRGV